MGNYDGVDSFDIGLTRNGYGAYRDTILPPYLSDYHPGTDSGFAGAVDDEDGPEFAYKLYGRAKVYVDQATGSGNPNDMLDDTNLEDGGTPQWGTANAEVNIDIIVDVPIRVSGFGIRCGTANVPDSFAA